MTRDAETATKKRDRGRRRLWPRWLKLRVVLVLLLLLGWAGWRYGWPTRSCETTVSPLEKIDWQEAARLAPQCIGNGGVRSVLMAEGTLDESGSPVFDVEPGWYVDPVILLRRDVLPALKLPDLSGRWFRAGVFWVDLPAEHDEAAAEALDPALAYAVLLTCRESERWEDAAELIVDLNRNRDLTDDPVMTLSDAWSHKDENARAELNWFVRVFAPVTLSRTAPGQAGDETLPANVQALPTLTVSYYSGELKADRLSLGFSPTSYRRGKLAIGGTTQDIVVSPDRTRFGRFDGPAPGRWIVGGHTIGGNSLTAWDYERGAFWGCTLDADGRELRDGPYEGPTGVLRAETARGESLRIASFRLWLRGSDPHMITSSGWAPIPRFPSYRLPLDVHPLPVGDYGINRFVLARGWNSSIVIEMDSRPMKPAPPAFSIHDGRTTRFRLPKTLKMQAIAAVEERPRPYVTEWVWSSDSDPRNDETNEWKGPQPGRTVIIQALMSDPAIGNRYSIYYRGDPPPDSLQLVIKDASGNTVHQDTMEYG